jgi:hypothetical protein
VFRDVAKLDCSRAALISLVLSLSASAAACQETSDRPPSLGCDGTDAGCAPYPQGGVGGGGRDSGRGDAGAGPVRDGGSDAGVTLTGTILTLGDDFVTSVPFIRAARIYAESPRGDFLSSAYDGQGEYSLSGVRASTLTWVGVKPTNAGAALPTLLKIDTTIAGPFTLAVVQADTIDRIFELITVPTTRQPGHGHVVVLFDDATEKPVSGVSVDMAQAAAIIYDAGGTYSDAVQATGSRGIAVLANIPAQTFPGSEHRLLWSGAATGFQEIFVAADSVTYVGFRVQP